MRKIRGASLLAAALAGVLLFSGCNTVSLIREMSDKAKKAAAPVTVATADERYTMSIRGAWKEAAPGYLSEDAVLELANDDQGCYVVLLTEAKEDFSEDFTLDNYIDVVLENLEEDLLQAQSEEGGALSVNGMRGETATVRGKLEVEILEGKTRKVDVVYWVDFLENGGDFVRVMGWTTGERADARREAVQDIMRSLKSVA